MSVTLEQCNKRKIVEQLDRYNEQTSAKLAVQMESKKTWTETIRKKQGGLKLSEKNNFYFQKLNHPGYAYLI